MTADFEHDFLIDVWTHPETGVVILGEDMPHELMPWTPRQEVAVIIRPNLPPTATLAERINETTERVRLIRTTYTLPIEATLGTSDAASAPLTA